MDLSVQWDDEGYFTVVLVQGGGWAGLESQYTTYTL